MIYNNLKILYFTNIAFMATLIKLDVLFMVPRVNIVQITLVDFKLYIYLLLSWVVSTVIPKA